MIQQGVFNKLKINYFKPQGAYLAEIEPEDENEDTVLLPASYVKEEFKEGDEIDVFVYTDSEDRLVAVTDKPNLMLHEFGPLKVKAVTDFGAFMDWGLHKDLLVPYDEQIGPMQEGRTYLIYVYHDEVSNRLVGSTKLSKFLHPDNITVKKGDEVDIVVWEATDLGYKVIVEDIHEGLMYHNEIFTAISVGQRMKAFVKNIREDKKLDISLQNIGYKSIEPDSQRVIDYLKEHGGSALLHDKTDPEVIKSSLGISKKAFKRAIGNLYKKGLIIIENDGIRFKQQRTKE